MKIKKKAHQKNVLLDVEYYTDWQIIEMLNNKEIFYLDRHYNECYDVNYELDIVNYRIFTSNLTDIKVVCEDGFYTNKAIGINGKEYYVEL